jgi:hypothetical protein
MFKGFSEAEIGCYLELINRLKENLKESRGPN